MVSSFAPQRHFVLSLLLLAGFASFNTLLAAPVTWSGGGRNQSWGTAANWAGGLVPLATDSVQFADTGSSNLPDATTSVLDMPRTIAGLSFANTNGHFQTIDLGTFALQVNGNVDVNTNVVDTSMPTIQDGTLNLGSASAPVNLSVGRIAYDSNGQAIATLDVTLRHGQWRSGRLDRRREIVGRGRLCHWYAQPRFKRCSFRWYGFPARRDPDRSQRHQWQRHRHGRYQPTSNFQCQRVADADRSGRRGAAIGTLKLAANNTINATTVRVGYSTENDNQSFPSELHLGAMNAITTSEFTVGGELSDGAVDIPTGGTLTLGTSAVPTNLTVGNSTLSTGQGQSGVMNLSGSTFNAVLSSLTVGQRSGAAGNGYTTGSLTGGSAGAITVGSQANPGNITIGHMAVQNTGGYVTGTVDFSGQTSLTANVNNLLLGTAEGGTATGTLKLAVTNNITANTIRVGYSTTNDNQASTSLLQLGASNTISTGELTVGGRLSNGTLTLAPGGSLTLGTIAVPTNLTVGQTNASTGQTQTGTMNLAAATFNAVLSDLTVGERLGASGNGSSIGTLTGGTAGTVVIGSQASPGNITIGHIDVPGTGGYAVGTVDFSGQGSFTANVENLLLGATEGGTSSGTLKLAATNTINANTIRVGYSTANDNQNSTSLLQLGASNTISTGTLTVGGQLSNGKLTMPSGGSLTLGTSGSPTNLTVSESDLATGQSYQGQMTVSGGTFNANLSSLAVGVKPPGRRQPDRLVARRKCGRRRHRLARLIGDRHYWASDFGRRRDRHR